MMLFWILFSIGIANTYYTSYVFLFELSLISLLQFQLYTLAVGFIPIVGITFWNQNKLLKKHLKTAGELNSTLHAQDEKDANEIELSLVSSNKKQNLEIFWK